jgi:coenzyme PQQ synthesis protein D (PqqD)
VRSPYEGQRFAVAGDVLCEVLDGEAVLLDLERGIYYGLNGTGTRVWELLRDGSDFSTVRERLLDEFAADAEEIEGDLERLLGDLLERRIIVAV